MNSNLETVIGLEVHLQFKTKTKIFCGCVNEFGRAPNSATCPVCLGMPGTLPVFNRTALEYAIKVALALNCEINSFVQFDRKNYYYPDLPKGYQISQHANPIARNGYVLISDRNNPKKIRVHRAHLEEDAGKLVHDTDPQFSLVDYNRTGTPLLEIVTEPDISSPQEAYEYLTNLKLILQYLNVSDCDMEKGSLRCDANVSVHKKGDAKLGTKTEIKNLNSFRAVKLALEYEANRHAQLFLKKERIIQETRLWNEEKGLTITMRSKEEAHDYRYFPEPDLVPFVVDQETITRIQGSLPESPSAKLERLVKQYQIPEYDAQIIIQNPDLADFFETCTRIYDQNKKICNWIIGPLQQELNTRKVRVSGLNLTPAALIELIKKVEDGAVSNLIGKEILPQMIDEGKSAAALIQEKGLAQVSDEQTLEKMIDEIILENKNVVDQIRQGKESAMGFLVGQVMKKSSGKANPKKIGELFRRRLLNA